MYLFSFVLATTTSYVFIFKTFFCYPAMSNGMIFVETNSHGATPRKKRNILIMVVEVYEFNQIIIEYNAGCTNKL